MYFKLDTSPKGHPLTKRDKGLEGAWKEQFKFVHEQKAFTDLLKDINEKLRKGQVVVQKTIRCLTFLVLKEHFRNNDWRACCELLYEVTEAPDNNNETSDELEEQLRQL